MQFLNTKFGKKILNKKIGKRFSFIFSIVILISAIGIAYLMFNMVSQKGDVDSIYKVRLISIENLIEADRDAYQSSIAISQLINAYYENKVNAAKIKKGLDGINENLGQIKERFDKFAKLYLDSGGEKVQEFGIFETQYSELNHFTQAITKYFSAGDYKSASKVYEVDYSKAFGSVRNAMDVLTGVSLDLTEKEYNTFNASFRTSIVISVVVALLIIFVLIFSGIFLTQSIKIPIYKCIKFAEKIAQGNFSERIELEQQDEFGDLTASLNTAADDLEKLISEIKNASMNLITAVEQISEGNADLSQRTTEQASAIEEIASTVEEATATINQNSQNSENANSLSEKTKSMADQGKLVVFDAVKSMDEINESSKEIQEIIDLIDSISSQTNMLSLNASIEAARAGEYGKGFAVVADEVRTLAQQSADAASKIENLIKQSAKKIENGTLLAKQSGDSLREIVVSMDQLARIIAELTHSSLEQKQGMVQINVAIEEIDKMTQQNAALVEETAASSEEMAAQALELKNMMNNFVIRN